MSATLVHVLLLIVALPLQIALLLVNRRTRWLTPGELRFWTIALFVFVEIGYLVLSQAVA
jgi:hypothetical protein